MVSFLCHFTARASASAQPEVKNTVNLYYLAPQDRMRLFRKIVPLILLLTGLIPMTSRANMAAPWEEGNLLASPYISRHVDILHERIDITLSEGLTYAVYRVEYLIEVDTTGSIVPFLFYAPEYYAAFKVVLDTTELFPEQVPEAYEALDGTPLQEFSDLFHHESWSDKLQIDLRDGFNVGLTVSTDALKFFHADLTRGRHTIKVEYHAEPYVDESDWTRQVSFRYALFPATMWKSFGSLEVRLDASATSKTIGTNLGKPSEGDLTGIAKWHFKELPADLIIISYEAELSALAAFLIALDPLGLTIIFGLLLMMLHIYGIWRYRRRFPRPKLSWVAIVGGLILPLVWLVGYILAYPFIDWVIGADDASKRHGYIFLVIIFYPVIAPVYTLMAMAIDWLLKRRFRKNTPTAV